MITTLITHAFTTICAFNFFRTINSTQKQLNKFLFLSTCKSKPNNISIYERRSCALSSFLYDTIDNFVLYLSGIFNLLFSSSISSFRNLKPMKAHELHTGISCFKIFSSIRVLSFSDYYKQKDSFCCFYLSSWLCCLFFFISNRYLTVIFSVFKRYFLNIKFDFKKVLKQKNSKTVLFPFLFLLFFTNTFQIYFSGNNTLIIYNESDFANENSSSIICVIIYANLPISSGEFSEWPKLQYVYIGNLVTSIGGSAFSGCSSLETVLFGENVKEIGGSAFANCIKLANVTIPSLVTSIGISAFSGCSSLETVLIGENVKEIGGSAFANCIKLANVTVPSSVTSIGGYAFFNCSNLYNVIIGENVKEIGGSAFACCVMLKCIYFYGVQEPNVENSAFINVTATQVMVLSEYKDKCFGTLAVCIDTTVAGCAPMPTLPFAPSNTFSSSNTFAASLRGDISQTFSFTLTVTLSVSYSLTYSALGTQTLSYYLSNSMITYVETNFIYYSYTVIVYSTYYSYYSNFFTYVYLSPSDASGGMTTAALIGIICGAVAFVLIVVAAVTFLVKSNNRKEKSSVKLQFKETTTSTTKQYDDVDSIVEELAKEDEDNWI